MPIFRREEIRPGDRVVIRHHQGDHTTDVIGHVISLSDEDVVVRPQTIGGFVSSLPEKRILRARIAVLKKLSPRRIRNSDIRHIELAYSKAFPGIEHTWTKDGQWLMRAGDGITERSNSAAPLGPSAAFSALPLEEFQDFYARHNLPVRILVPERIGAQALKTCQGQQSASLGPEIIVMCRDLDDIPLADHSLDFEPCFRIDEQPDEAWLSLYHFRGRPLPPRALDLLRERIDGHMIFARLTTPEGETIAITRGTITRAGGVDYLGYSAVEVASGYRRKGLGTLLGAHLLAWGQRQGAEMAYLQVIATNQAGIGLYEKLGFSEHHRHRYLKLS